MSANNWARTHQAIKAYYENMGGKKWHEVSADHRFFNRVWRAMLRLPKSDNPPPVAYRV